MLFRTRGFQEEPRHDDTKVRWLCDGKTIKQGANVVDAFSHSLNSSEIEDSVQREVRSITRKLHEEAYSTARNVGSVGAIVRCLD